MKDFTPRAVATLMYAYEFNLCNEKRLENNTNVYVLPSTNISRTHICGVLSDFSSIGGDNSFRSAHLTDCTGTAYVKASMKYQPDAAPILAGITEPTIVSVVGKPDLYMNQDGEIRMSIFCEALFEIGVSEYQDWIVTTAEHTLRRIDTISNDGTKQEMRDMVSKALKSLQEHHE